MHARRLRLFPDLLGLIGGAVLLSGTFVHASDVSMQLQDQGHGAYTLEGHIAVKATPYEVWKVLTDYENISKFVSSLRRSTITDSSTDRVLLEQEALGKELFISKRIKVVLAVTETPYHQIDFQDILKKDFASYKGSWEIYTAANGLDVTYRLQCKRSFMVPNFLAKDALKKSAQGLLTDVLNEIIRRQGGKPHA
jgi:hypothetical protein